MSHSNPREDIHPNDDDEIIGRVEIVETIHDPQLIDAPEADTLSSQDGRGANEILTELLTQIRFLGTRIIALEERAIVGATISAPTADTMTPPITPEIISSTLIPPAVPSPTSLTLSELIGDFLPHERNLIDLEFNSMQVISKDERTKLNASDKSKLFFMFSKGIPNKFKGNNTIIGLDNASTISNISSFSEQRLELQKHITGIAAHPVFLILRFNPTGMLINPDNPEGKPSNILSSNVLPTLEEVEKSTFFHYKRGTKYNQENLTWSYEAIRNSCDKDLQAILDAKVLKYNTSERFGPIYYFQLVHHMTTVDSKAIRAITQELTNLKVPDQEGESIIKICKLIRSTILWLDMVNMTPPDLYAIVYEILESCTVPDFRLFLNTFTTNATLNQTVITTEELLNKSEEQYRLLILSKKWNSTQTSSSSFQVQRHTRTTPERSNQRMRDVPINQRMRDMPSWVRTPPIQDEPHERTHQHNIYKWCDTCGKWFYGNRAHFTNEHVQGFRNQNPSATSSAINNIIPSHNQNDQGTTNPNTSEGMITRTYFRDGL
jgi:hypothetical protein